MRFISLILAGVCVIATPARGQVPEPPVIPSAADRESAAAEAPAADAATPRADDDRGAPATATGESVDSGAPTGEEVSERVEGDQIITEYRRRGQLYMVKVKPKNGPAQYWVDRDGDGQFQRRDTDINEDINLPKWRIGTW